MRRLVAPSFALALLAGTPLLAGAQSACSSDGQPPPHALVERFLSADCESCWASAPWHAPGPTALTLDWIVPGAQGDEAPLSAAATPDALQRLRDLQRPSAAATDTHITDLPAPTGRTALLRVARGPAMNDYVGTGIRFAPPRALAAQAPYTFTLVLIETLPAGAEGSPVARNVVRNALQGTWNASAQGLPRGGWTESRPMRIPEGAQPQRLHVAGWVQDAAGHVLAAAQSRCEQGH